LDSAAVVAPRWRLWPQAAVPLRSRSCMSVQGVPGIRMSRSVPTCRLFLRGGKGMFKCTDAG
jgi:hypothetical protein